MHHLVVHPVSPSQMDSETPSRLRPILVRDTTCFTSQKAGYICSANLPDAPLSDPVQHVPAADGCAISVTTPRLPAALRRVTGLRLLFDMQQGHSLIGNQTKERAAEELGRCLCCNPQSDCDYPQTTRHWCEPHNCRRSPQYACICMQITNAEASSSGEARPRVRSVGYWPYRTPLAANRDSHKTR